MCVCVKIDTGCVYVYLEGGGKGRIGFIGASLNRLCEITILALVGSGRKGWCLG